MGRTRPSYAYSHNVLVHFEPIGVCRGSGIVSIHAWSRYPHSRQRKSTDVAPFCIAGETSVRVSMGIPPKCSTSDPSSSSAGAGVTFRTARGGCGCMPSVSPCSSLCCIDGSRTVEAHLGRVPRREGDVDSGQTSVGASVGFYMNARQPCRAAESPT